MPHRREVEEEAAVVFTCEAMPDVILFSQSLTHNAESRHGVEETAFRSMRKLILLAEIYVKHFVRCCKRRFLVHFWIDIHY
jgi:hypothetical protein